MINLWVRHAIASRWCYVAEQGDSIVSHCHGRFAASDEHETSANPPRGERCACCHAAYREERRTACVAELAALEIDCECSDRPHAGFCVASIQYEWPGVYELEDK